ncbi:hypothetical protein [Paenibacillus chitinolyticus]|uniref:hypothetical protein n=1 Tax=Paenibacillus chitinolyticus TaxID=79263 RepID=UPI0036502011
MNSISIGQALHFFQEGNIVVSELGQKTKRKAAVRKLKNTFLHCYKVFNFTFFKI